MNSKGVVREVLSWELGIYKILSIVCLSFVDLIIKLFVLWKKITSVA